MVNFVLSQVCGLIVMIFTIVGIQFKKAEKIVFFECFANFFMIIEYLFMWALTGAVVSAINTIRCVVFYFIKKKNKNPSVIVLIIFEIFMLVSGYLSWQSWWSLLPIVCSCLFTFAIWQNNVLVIKSIRVIVGVGWVGYNYVSRVYVGMIEEAIQVVFTLIALFNLINYNKKHKNDTNILNEENVDQKILNQQ